jgi:hypothetical protein
MEVRLQRGNNCNVCYHHLDEECSSMSETSVCLYQTTLCNIPQRCHLHIRRHENLKSHIYTLLFLVHLTTVCQ